MRTYDEGLADGWEGSKEAIRKILAMDWSDAMKLGAIEQVVRPQSEDAIRPQLRGQSTH